MKARWPLLLYFLRRTLPVNLLALPLALLYILFAPGPMSWIDWWTGIFILCHSLLLTVWIGTPGSPGSSYLYTRGFSRPSLWCHLSTALLLSVMEVWAPVASALWLRLRSAVQAEILRSPYFPACAAREDLAPWAWLLWYFVLLSAFQYHWIRFSQPNRGREGVTWLVTAVILSAAAIQLVSFGASWFKMVLVVAAGAIGLIFLVSSRHLHQSIEIQP